MLDSFDNDNDPLAMADLQRHATGPRSSADCFSSVDDDHLATAMSHSRRDRLANYKKALCSSRTSSEEDHAKDNA